MTQQGVIEVQVHFENGKWQVNGEGNFGSKMAAYAEVERIRRQSSEPLHVTVFKKDGSVQLEVGKARGSKIVIDRVQARAASRKPVFLDPTDALLEMLPEQGEDEGASIADYIAPRQGAVKKLTATERFVRALDELAGAE
jgi:hypothetical protein